MLYLDYSVDHSVASVSWESNSVGLLSGSSETNTVGLSDTWMDSFGRYDTRYTTPKTTPFISQPFGQREYDLFRFESLSDGAYGNSNIKISISNLVASTDPNNPYGTFNVEVRKIDDLDTDTQLLEVFPQVTLNPSDERYIGRQIGDMSARFNFDAEQSSTRKQGP